MRTTKDRIRHALLFELLAILTATPLGGLFFGLPMAEFGVVTVVSSLVAMAWNYVYNHAFDRVLLHRRGSAAKTMPLRILHAILFELGLTVLLVPLIAFYLGVTLWQALVMDVLLIVYFLVYALIFNIAYDRIFPLPAAPGATAP